MIRASEVTWSRSQECSLRHLFFGLVFFIGALIEPVHMAGGGRGIAVTAKGGKGKSVARPHDPNESNGSWAVVFVVIVPVAQMFVMVAICVGIFHCYQKFCSKIACCCYCCPNINRRTVSRWSKVRSSKGNGKTIKEILDSLEVTSVARGFPSVTSSSSLDVVIQPPESFQTVSVVNSPAPVSPVAVCQLHLPSNGGIANLTAAAATLPNGPIEDVSSRGYIKSANSNTSSSSAKQVGKPSIRKQQMSCIVHPHYPTPLNGRSLVGPYSARVYPSSRPSGHGLLQHSDAVSQDSTSNSVYFSAHPENVILNVLSDELDDLEVDSDCAVPELEELFYTAHPHKPPCRLHNPTMPTTSTQPTRSISAQTALHYQSYPRNFMNSH